MVVSGRCVGGRPVWTPPWVDDAPPPPLRGRCPPSHLSATSFQQEVSQYKPTEYLLTTPDHIHPTPPPPPPTPPTPTPRVRGWLVNYLEETSSGNSSELGGTPHTPVSLTPGEIGAIPKIHTSMKCKMVPFPW